MHLEHKHGDYNIALESCPKSKNKPPLTPEQILDSIAGRLRQRRDKVHGHDERFTGMKDDSLDAKQAVNNISSGSEAEANTSSLHFTSPTVDSIAGRTS
ncbi:hypothetical protein F0562_003877 [Nyssa sinensis]|uniref:Uncharacterized protein n=1 Tax=Nyssa sinensis TaxID=561372 RepID=A0A5J5BW61_9ASTE|nr:hypothetical protein F0562_003877 [Nyssa sinensis]